MMEEYRNWLERVIAEERIAVQGGADDSKLKACEECLRKVVQIKNKAVDFYSLGIGKKYVSVFNDGRQSNVFVVFDKDCDDKGGYIWYYYTENDRLAFKMYEQDCKDAEHFREVKFC